MTNKMSTVKTTYLFELLILVLQTREPTDVDMWFTIQLITTWFGAIAPTKELNSSCTMCSCYCTKYKRQLFTGWDHSC